MGKWGMIFIWGFTSHLRKIIEVNVDTNFKNWENPVITVKKTNLKIIEKNICDPFFTNIWVKNICQRTKLKVFIIHGRYGRTGKALRTLTKGQILQNYLHCLYRQIHGGSYAPLRWTLFPMVFLDQYVEGVEKKNSPPQKNVHSAPFWRFFEF